MTFDNSHIIGIVTKTFPDFLSITRQENHSDREDID